MRREVTATLASDPSASRAAPTVPHPQSVPAIFRRSGALEQSPERNRLRDSAEAGTSQRPRPPPASWAIVAVTAAGPRAPRRFPGPSAEGAPALHAHGMHMCAHCMLTTCTRVHTHRYTHTPLRAADVRVTQKPRVLMSSGVMAHWTQAT